MQTHVSRCIGEAVAMVCCLQHNPATWTPTNGTFPFCLRTSTYKIYSANNHSRKTLLNQMGDRDFWNTLKAEVTSLQLTYFNLLNTTRFPQVEIFFYKQHTTLRTSFWHPPMNKLAKLNTCALFFCGVSMTQRHCGTGEHRMEILYGTQYTHSISFTFICSDMTDPWGWATQQLIWYTDPHYNSSFGLDSSKYRSFSAIFSKNKTQSDS